VRPFTFDPPGPRLPVLVPAWSATHTYITMYTGTFEQHFIRVLQSCCLAELADTARNSISVTQTGTRLGLDPWEHLPPFLCVLSVVVVAGFTGCLIGSPLFVLPEPCKPRVAAVHGFFFLLSSCFLYPLTVRFVYSLILIFRTQREREEGVLTPNQAKRR
jgi:hypothetical protein